MKKIMSFCAILCATVALISSCNPTQKPEQEEPANLPVIELANGGQASIGYEGGEIEMAYTIQNPVEGGAITVSVPEGNDWITAKVETGKIIFTVAQNEGSEARSEMIPVEYKYGEESVKAYANIIQEFIDAVLRIEAEAGNCTYYSNAYSADPNLMNYTLGLSAADGYIGMSLDLYAPEDTEDHNVPAGMYTAYEAGKEEGYALSVGEQSYSYFYKINDSYTDYEIYTYPGLGSYVEVSRDGDIVTVEALFVDGATGENYLITYSGELSVSNGLINSQLTEDLDVTYDAAEDGLVAYMNYYGPATEDFSAGYWALSIEGVEWAKGQPIIRSEFLTLPEVTPAEEVDALLGTYIIDPEVYTNVAPGTALPGSYSYTGTWFLEITEMDGTSAYVSGAPFSEGAITIESDGDGTYTFILSGKDDNYEEYHTMDIVVYNVPIQVADATQQSVQAASFSGKTIVSEKGKKARKASF